jgi:GAF domain-containing protein
VVIVDTASDERSGDLAVDSAHRGDGAAPAADPATTGPTTLDVLPEEALQRTTAMAARLFDAPIALIEVLDEDREWSQSYLADGVDKSARSITFRNGFAPVPVPVVIPDGSTHPEMRNSPLVTGPLGIRFYASVPIVRHDGETIGTLAVLDSRPRTADEADLANLRDLAALAVTQLELRQESLRNTSDGFPLPRNGGAQSGAAQTGAAQTGAAQTGAGPTGAGPTGAGQTGGSHAGGRHTGDVRRAPTPDHAG